VSQHTILVARLKAVTGVTDLVVARIWPLARQSDTLPAIVYETVSDSPVNYAGGTNGTAEARFLVRCYDDSYAGAWALADAVRAALSGWADANGCVWHLDQQTDGDPIEAPGRDTIEAYEVAQEYTVWYST